MKMNQLKKAKDLISFILIIISPYIFAQAGSDDASFNVQDNISLFNEEVTVVVVQTDGKIIVGGNFTTFNSKPQTRIARLNPDGSLDESFSVGVGFDDIVYSIVLQPDGKIIVGGNFTFFNGIFKNGIVRLNQEGSLDENFVTDGINVIFNIYSSYPIGKGAVYSIAIQPDGKIIVAGSYRYSNDLPSYGISRLNSDGSLDNSFSIGRMSNRVYTVVYYDEKILIGGDFSSFNGINVESFACLNLDGTLKSSFFLKTNFAPRSFPKVRAMVVQPDGKILIGGLFRRTYGENSLFRFNPNGSNDESFDIGKGFNSMSTVKIIVLQPDGKIIIGGDFNSFNGITQNKIARLNPAGDLDRTFEIGKGFSGTVNSIVIRFDDKIIVGGKFTTYDNNTQKYLAILNSDGRIGKNFTVGNGLNDDVNSVVLQEDGKIILGGKFTNFNGISKNRIVRLNSDGSLDESFSVGLGFDNIVHSIAMQSDKKIIVAGRFTSFNQIQQKSIVRLNPDGSLDESFSVGIKFDRVESVLLQADGKIVVGGLLANINEYTEYVVFRLNSNGSLDDSFSFAKGFKGTIVPIALQSIALQSDGKILIGGHIYSFIENDYRETILRLNTDGSFDESFIQGTGLNVSVVSIVCQPDGKIIVTGLFKDYSGIIRLNSNGSIDTDFIIVHDNLIVNSIAQQQNGKIIIGGSDNNDGKINYKIIRYHSNGSLDNDFKMGEGFNNIINSIAVQSDGRIILGGKFTSFNQIPRNYVARVFGDVDFSTKSMVFPNPTKDILNINNGNFNQAHVYDMSGRLVKTVSIINRQINLSELSIGYYFVQLQENNNKETFKIVKQ